MSMAAVEVATAEAEVVADPIVDGQAEQEQATEEHDHIQRIQELRRHARVAEALLEDAKSLVKDRRENYEHKVKLLLDAIDQGPQQLPLFSSANMDNREVSESFASVNGDGADATPSADATASTPEEVPAADDSWKSVTISELGLNGKLAESLTEANLNTLEDIANWSSSGKLLTDIPGVGPKKAEQIEEAMEKYWKDHPRQAIEVVTTEASEVISEVIGEVLENPPTKEEHFKAIYNAGRKACKEGVPSMQNPCVDPDSRAAWNNGWNDEFGEADKEEAEESKTRT